MLELNKIYCGACETVMRDIDSNSVNCIVTDPPYGLSFMGKDWDKAVPSIEIWQECLRVLKPGAFAFVMCIPRQDCLARMICRLEDAGFNISFSSVHHCFAQGFPKSQNLSKQADKRAGVKQEVVGQYQDPDGHKRIYKNHNPDNAVAFQNNVLNYNKAGRPIILASTEQAKALEGAYAGMQLKPAVEIVIVAMKPIEEKTYLDQALENGHGCAWLDNARIPFESPVEKQKAIEREGMPSQDIRSNAYCKQNNPNIDNARGDYSKGRFPANVICENNVLSDGIERKTGDVKPHSQTPNLFCSSDKSTSNHKGDKGSFSRYFSLDAWFAERIKHLPKEAQKTFPFMIIPKASKSERNRGLKDESNIHPTCKVRVTPVIDGRNCERDRSILGALLILAAKNKWEYGEISSRL